MIFEWCICTVSVDSVPAVISTLSSSIPQQVMTIVSAPTLSSNAQGALYSAASSVQIPNSPSRPSILRRREGERDIPGNR